LFRRWAINPARLILRPKSWRIPPPRPPPTKVRRSDRHTHIINIFSKKRRGEKKKKKTPIMNGTCHKFSLWSMIRSPSHDGLGKGGHIALEIRCIGPNFPPSFGTPYPAFYYYYEKEIITKA
jgi:hypothetical protein